MSYSTLVNELDELTGLMKEKKERYERLAKESRIYDAHEKYDRLADLSGKVMEELEGIKKRCCSKPGGGVFRCTYCGTQIAKGHREINRILQSKSHGDHECPGCHLAITSGDDYEETEG